MTQRNISFSKPFFTDKDLDEITTKLREVLRSGWLTSGSMVKKLEERFAEYVGSRYAVTLNSCTAALHAILLSSGVKSGDEVIVPSNTFVATANVALYVGARPVFADSDPETFNISPSEVQNKISRKTKVVIVVHLGGSPCDMKEIIEIAEDYKVLVIEDAAHAHGAKYREEYCGTMGLAGAFSFYPTKVVTTAEGGIITTHNKDVAERVRVIRNHGRVAYGPSEVVELGFNYRLSEVHAIIGLSQLNHVGNFVMQRNIIAKMYSEELSKIKWIIPQRIREGNLCSYYAYIVKLHDDAPVTRDKLIQKLRDQGVATSVMYHPIHLQPFYVDLFNYRRGILPVAEELGDRNLALPLYNGMSVEDASYVIDVMKYVVEEVER